jgi:hypothetical protein
MLTELDVQPWARGPEGTVPTEGFDAEAYLAERGENIPEEPSDVFRVTKPQLNDVSNYFYARLQMYQSDADDPAYRAHGDG